MNKTKGGAGKLIRVLLVDQDVLFRKGMQAHLRNAAGISVVGVAGTGPQAVQVAVQKCPQVVVMDCGLSGGMSARVVARQIVKALPSARLIGLCDANHDGQKIVSIFQAGAAGVIEKAVADHDISKAIRAVHSGHFYLGPSLVRTLIAAFIAAGNGRSVGTVRNLSKREAEILRLILMKLTSKEIALILEVSKRTVDTYRSRIRNKTGRAMPRA